MVVTCTETEYRNFGKCVCIENGIIKLMATVDFGPRIIYFGLCGKENLLFEDYDRNFSQDVRELGTWYTYGGHRLWCAPEVMPETYYPDNEKVEYSFESGVLTLTAPQTPFGKQISIICSMSENDDRVQITNKVKNCSGAPAHFAPWSITALALGGTEIIPLNTENTGFLPNRAISLWSYSDICDSRFKLYNNIAVLKQDASSETRFKVGFNVTDGYCAYILGEQMFVKSFGKYENVKYPDFSSNFETFTDKYFLESELVGEERDYAHLEEAVVSEIWRVLPYTDGKLPDDESISAILNKYI